MSKVTSSTGMNKNIATQANQTATKCESILTHNLLKTISLLKSLTVTHTSSRTSKTFYDNYFKVTGVPMTNKNTIILHEALNDDASIYKDGGFNPSPNGSSYTISVRGYLAQTVFNDVATIQAYIISKLNSCSSKLEQRDT
jgi:hypothetical protein